MSRAPRPSGSPTVELASHPPSLTLPPTALPQGVAAAQGSPVPPPLVRNGTPAAVLIDPAVVESLLAELRAVRRTQEQILGAIDRLSDMRPAAQTVDHPVPDDNGLTPVRQRHRKSVVIIDDDDATREAARAELELADVPVRAYADGRAGVEAIAQEKPDVIALEIGVGGEMAGKDVINVIKATMEWIDLPIILYTRLPIESQKEARLVHGADEVIPKSRGPAALVSRVISLFRRTS